MWFKLKRYKFHGKLLKPSWQGELLWKEKNALQVCKPTGKPEAKLLVRFLSRGEGRAEVFNQRCVRAGALRSSQALLCHVSCSPGSLWSVLWSHMLYPAAQMLLEQKLSTAPYGTFGDSRTFWAECMETFVSTCQCKLTDKQHGRP